MESGGGHPSRAGSDLNFAAQEPLDPLFCLTLFKEAFRPLQLEASSGHVTESAPSIVSSLYSGGKEGAGVTASSMAFVPALACLILTAAALVFVAGN